MLFSSLTFLFLFLPLTIACYFLAKDKYKNYILLVASLIFYAWGEPKYVILMILSIVFNYFIARAIGQRKTSKKQKRSLLALAVIINIGALFFFKYLNFTIHNLNLVFGVNFDCPDLVMPIGISFYTFQILSYVIDVYRKKVPVQKNIFSLGTYIALFPQLIAGPIVRYSLVEKQLKKREHSVEKVCSGFRRFIVGFGKKVLIANNVAILADAVFNNPTAQEHLGAGAILLGLLAYTLQIYYDFSGYSDMAIGLGRIFGFDFEENFNYPYIATSIADFWRRWHISLTSWFRDYLYIPLGGNRCSKIKWVRNFLAVWLFTGLWHGASWNFILWGLFYAVILLAEKQLLGRYLAKMPRAVAWAITFAIVNLGWLLFRVNSLGDLAYILQTAIHPNGSLVEFFGGNFSLIPSLTFMIIGILFMFPIWKKLARHVAKKPTGQLLVDVLLIVVLVFGVMALVSSAYNPFIYFRF